MASCIKIVLKLLDAASLCLLNKPGRFSGPQYMVEFRLLWQSRVLRKLGRDIRAATLLDARRVIKSHFQPKLALIRWDPKPVIEKWINLPAWSSSFSYSRCYYARLLNSVGCNWKMVGLHTLCDLDLHVFWMRISNTGHTRTLTHLFASWW